MTDDQKIELGIEIISAMKASAYDCSIEIGRIYALEGTEVDKFELITTEYFETLQEDEKNRLKEMAVTNKKRLHEQAIFIADIAINKLNQIN